MPWILVWQALRVVWVGDLASGSADAVGWTSPSLTTALSPFGLSGSVGGCGSGVGSSGGVAWGAGNLRSCGCVQRGGAGAAAAGRWSAREGGVDGADLDVGVDDVCAGGAGLNV